MIKLTKQNYEKAKNYILQNGRPLEKALYKYHFEDGALEDVLLQLSKYQNEDGGFGHCLESDARLEASNCLASSVAFQIITELKLCEKHPMVKKGINYFIKEYKKDFKGWLMLPSTVSEVPRAIWWDYDGNPENKYTVNPSAEICGYLSEYKELVPENILKEAANEAIDYLKEHFANLSMHDIFCYQRMAQCLPEKEKSMVIDILKKSLRNATDFNSSNWTGYAARPLSYVHAPSDELCSMFTAEELESNLDYLVNEQQKEGYWLPNWSWGRFDEEWEIAKKEWIGHITLQNLRILKAFNRIESLI